MIKKKIDRRFSKSIRTHIRRQKAEIRRRCATPAEYQRLVNELYSRFGGGKIG